jgi:hypothetical protein
VRMFGAWRPNHLMTKRSTRLRSSLKKGESVDRDSRRLGDWQPAAIRGFGSRCRGFPEGSDCRKEARQVMVQLLKV